MSSISHSDRIEVAARLRPLSSSEKRAFWEVCDDTLINTESKERYQFFDKLFAPHSSNEDIFANIQKIVDNVVEGFNGAVISYGQSGSGKTHTLTGSGSVRGLMQLVIDYILKAIADKKSTFIISVSYLQIYNEKVSDLLTDSDGDLTVRDGPSGTLVEGLTSRVITNLQSIEDVLIEGAKRREVGSTQMNDRSSRSHTILRIQIESSDNAGNDFLSTLQLVDLAGSECAAQTGASGIRAAEGNNINKSLLAFSRVIKQLSEQNQRSGSHVSYRDSKLTRLLKSCLGGNALTALICTLNPCDLPSTNSTITFAKLAMNVQNRAIRNKKKEGEGDLGKYVKEIERLKKELQSSKEQAEAKAKEDMQNKIENLQSLLLGGGSQDVEEVKEKKKANRRFSWAPGAMGGSGFSLSPYKRKRTALKDLGDSLNEADDEKKLRSDPLFISDNLNFSVSRSRDFQEEFTPISDRTARPFTPIGENVSPPDHTSKRISQTDFDVLRLQFEAEKETTAALNVQLEQLNDIVKSSSDLNRQLLEAESARATLEEQLREIQSKPVEDATLIETENLLVNERSKVSALEQRLVVLQSVEEDLHHNKAIAAKFEEEIGSLKEKMTALESNSQHLESEKIENSRLTKIIEDLKSTLSSGEVSTAEYHRNMELKISTLEEEIIDLNEKLNVANSRINEYKDEVEKHQDVLFELRDFRDSLNVLERIIADIECEKDTLDEKLKQVLHVECSTRANLQNEMEEINDRYKANSDIQTEETTELSKLTEAERVRADVAENKLREIEQLLEKIRKDCDTMMEEQKKDYASSWELYTIEMETLKKSNADKIADMGSKIKKLELNLDTEQACHRTLSIELIELREKALNADEANQKMLEMKQQRDMAQAAEKAIRDEEISQQARINHLEKTIEEKNEDLRLIEIRINDLSDEVSELRDKEDTLKLRFDAAQEEINNMTKSHEEQVLKLMEKENHQSSEYQKHITDLQEELRKSEESMNGDLSTALTQFKSDKEALLNRIREKEIEIADLKEELTNVRTEIGQELIGKVEEKMKADEEEIKQLRNELHLTKERLTIMLTTSSGEEEGIANEKIEELNAKIAHFEDVVELLNSKVQDRESQIQELTKEKQASEVSLQRLKLSLANMSDMNETLKDRAASYRYEISDNKTKIEEATLQFEAEKADLKVSYSKEISRLANLLTEANRKLMDSEGEIRLLGSKLNIAKTSVNVSENEKGQLQLKMGKLEMSAAQDKRCIDSLKTELEAQTEILTRNEQEISKLKSELEEEKFKNNLIVTNSEETTEASSEKIFESIIINKRSYTKLEELVERIAELEKQRAAGLKKYDDMKSELTTSKKAHTSVFSKYKEYKEKYTVLLENKNVIGSEADKENLQS